MATKSAEREVYLLSFYKSAEVIRVMDNYPDYTTFLCDLNGDICIFRVYGEAGNYTITER